MKIFLKNILIFSLLVFLVDKLFLLILLYSPYLEADKRLEKLINGEINKDIIVMGSSRGARDILAYKLQDSLNQTTFNLAFPGSDIVFHEFILKTLLKFNKKPKTIFLVVDDPEELQNSASLNFRYDRLYPLVRYNYINDELIRRDQKIHLSKFFYLSRMNVSNLNLKEKKFTELDTLLQCGSMPISFQRTDRPFKNDSMQNTYDLKLENNEKLKAFQNFQNICHEEGINLIIIFPPNLKNHNPIVENRLKKISKPETIFYIYNDLNPVYQNKSYYYDEAHLLTKGAHIFTDEVILWYKNSVH